MTDLDLGLIIGSFLTGMILWFLKMSIHFDYLKIEKGKFKEVESLVYLIFRPIYCFEHLHEMFVIFNVPVLWNIKESKRKFQMGVLSYGAIAILVFTISYIVVTN